MWIDILYDSVLVEVVLGILGVLLISVGLTYGLPYLAWIGGPLAVGSVFYHYYKSRRGRRRRELRL